jgi:phytoene dehydrogenase-like protein
MNHEVVVVGGGIGGLTAAALLAARGVDVCLFERQSRVGGCVANFEHLGYTFEPTAGLYSGWEPAGIYEKIFSELPVEPPNVQALSPAFVVRLPDGTEVAVAVSERQFEDDVRQAFPECAEPAVTFYRKLAEFNDPNGASTRTTPSTFFANCSLRFRRFIDVQLQTLTQCTSDRLSAADAARALTLPHRGMWTIQGGGAQALADALAESFKKSGGKLRMNAPVLRLAYASDGQPMGVDLLSGERVLAARAIISNLTIWDTYGKLIGLARTPASVSKQLKQLRGWGAYLLFLSMDQAAAQRLKSNRIVVLTDWQEGQNYLPDQTQFIFAIAPDGGRAPEGKLAVTVSTFTDAEDWFTFHEDESAHEQKDRATLELVWTRLHAAMPELGDSVEVIETATPQTFYETTRRKFGMVGGLCSSGVSFGWEDSFRTIFPNVFLVGDTVSSSPGLAGISESAKAIADIIRNPSRGSRRRSILFARRLR